MYIFTVNNCSFRYGKKDVLFNIFGTVKKGDFTVIIGPSGAGKSTLLKLFSRDLFATEGEVLFKDKKSDLWETKDFAKELAVIHQQNDVSLSYSVYDFITMGRFPHIGVLGGYRQEDYLRTDDAIKTVEIEHLAERDVTTLSGGEFQLVSLARAMCQSREVILLDEPVAHLDPALSKKVFTLLENLNKEGSTIVVVAHDINLAASFGKSFWAVKKGRIIHSGSGEKIFTTSVIEDIYDISCPVGKHPKTGKPVVFL